MTDSPRDSLLRFGKMLARLLQGMCALAGGILLLLVPVVLLRSQGMLPGAGGAGHSDIIGASPLAVVGILAMLALIVAAIFSFFGKLRLIIVSADEGDPFTPENARRLNAMAWLFLGVKLLAALVGGVRLYLANLVATDANGSDSLNFSVYDLDALVIVVVLFILARIFRHGAEMREDLNGTV